ncbi:MAG: xanthine dehydrogenase small subunit [Deltaproteobacteria bacterium]|nr:xanthine dehydrogenase small subunit [Deltaproteobacteria bacterium]
MDALELIINGRTVRERDVSPNTTLLAYLRGLRGLTGAKEGCAEGDCGACSVVIVDAERQTFRTVNACLVLLPMVHGKHVITVEGLADGSTLHPAQAALVEKLGSQCGYCTPGIVMSMFEATYRSDLDEGWKLDDQLCGNLCRCTGYRPIREAAESVSGSRPDDRFRALLSGPSLPAPSLSYERDRELFFMPRTRAELFELMDRIPDATLISGGTDLALEITKKFRTFSCLISLEGLQDLQKIEPGIERIRVGAGVRLTDLEAFAKQELVPIERMLRYFGSRQIKHRATLGGNLCTASPIGDLAPVLLSLGADAILTSRAGERRIALSEFFTGYRQTALGRGEVLAAVEIPRLGPMDRAAAYKVSKRQELDISAVSAGLFVRLDGEGRVELARFAYGGMAPTPSRATLTEAHSIGKVFDETLAAQLGDMLERDFSPIDDHRGSAWYRRTVARNLIIGFFHETARAPVPRIGRRPAGTVSAEVTPWE